MMSDDGISSVGAFAQDPNRNPNIPNPSKRKRSLPGAPDPNSEVVALSPKSLMATNRFICEVCNKGFQREQNLQLHRRGHNLPWKLKQRSNKEVRRKVYICPEKSCVHSDPLRALGDLTGIKKHYSRKHGEKKWKCQKCSKKYAVLSDLKAHSKVCGTREYKCDCGTIFSRKDSFITHRAFCDALAQQTARFNAPPLPTPNLNLRNHEVMHGGINAILQNTGKPQFPSIFKPQLGGLESRNHLNLDLQKLPRFPLWLDNVNCNNPIGNSRPCNSNYVATSSTSLQELEQMSWFNRGVLKEEDNSGNFYGTNLSQKAAQMGFSRSSSSMNFDTNFGLMNNFSNMGSFNSLSTTHSRNDVAFDHQNIGKCDELNGLMPSTTNGEHALWFKDMNSRNFDPLLLMTNGNTSCEIGDGSHTRDFLGVGGSEENGVMTKFASMDCAMNMSNHYSRVDL